MDQESKNQYPLTSDDKVETSQSRVAMTVESLRVIGLQARVSVESNEISHFSITLLWYEMAANMPQNGAQ